MMFINKVCQKLKINFSKEYLLVTPRKFFAIKKQKIEFELLICLLSLTENPAIVLNKVAGKGLLAVNTIPRGAKVFLNGEPIGDTSYSAKDLKIGYYTVRVAKDKYKEIEEDILIEKEQNHQF